MISLLSDLILAELPKYISAGHLDAADESAAHALSLRVADAIFKVLND